MWNKDDSWKVKGSRSLSSSMIRLEGAITGHTQILGLLLSQLAEVSRQEVNPSGIFIWVDPQLNWCRHLVCEGIVHHKARMAHGTTYLNQSTFRHQDNLAPIPKPVVVHLGLDVHLLHSVLTELLHIKVYTVTYNGAILLFKVPAKDATNIACGRDKDAALLIGLVTS